MYVNQNRLKLSRRQRPPRDRRAINHHHDELYEDSQGNCYLLGKVNDATPSYFELYGPFDENFKGVLPQIAVDGKLQWGDGLSWPQARKVMEVMIEQDILKWKLLTSNLFRTEWKKNGKKEYVRASRYGEFWTLYHIERNEGPKKIGEFVSREWAEEFAANWMREHNS